MSNFNQRLFEEVIPSKYIDRIEDDSKLTYRTYSYLKPLDSEFLLYLMLNNEEFDLLQRGKHTVLYSHKNQHQYILENTNLQSLIPSLKANSIDWKYTFSIRTVQYHTYVELKNHKTNQTLAFGAAQTEKGSMFSHLYIRNDTYYTNKYSKNHVDVEADAKNPHFNMGSLSVDFALDCSKARIVMQKLEEYHELYNAKLHPYDFLGYFGKNCADFVYDIMQNVGFDPVLHHYLRTDQLDLRDQGVMYHVWKDIGTIGYLYNMPSEFKDSVCNLAFKKSCTHIEESILSKMGFYSLFGHPITSLIPAAYTGNAKMIVLNLFDLDTPNFAGETPLHIALNNNQTAFALKLLAGRINLKATDHKGNTLLHAAASLPPSKDKESILKTLCTSKNVNIADSINYASPLTRAVLSEDRVAVKILMECGADASFINLDGDNIINIAVYGGKLGAIEPLHKADPSLIFFDNGEHQIPICKLYEQPDPQSILEDFNSIWASFDQSLCKTHSQLYSHLEL